MKKLLAIFPAHIDWSGALKDGLVFGMTAALAIHLLPALSRAFLATWPSARIPGLCRVFSDRN